MGILFTPFAVAFYSSHDDIAVFVGDANLSAIGGPLHVSNDRGFAVIDHFFDPLSVVFHEDYDSAGGVASCQLSVLLIPHNYHDISGVIG